MDNVKHTINFKKLHEMMQDRSLKPIEKALLVDLLLYAGVDGQAFPGHEKLAKDLVCSSRHISTCLSVLLAHGWLKDWQRRGYGKTNIYFFNEELYFNNDRSNRNTSSSHSGSKVPNNLGTLVPPNETHLINSSNEIKKVNRRYESIENVLEEDIKEIANQYKVPEGLVRLQLEALRNYCSAKGKRYKDYKAALKNFVIRDAERRIEKSYGDPTKRATDARKL